MIIARACSIYRLVAAADIIPRYVATGGTGRRRRPDFGSAAQPPPRYSAFRRLAIFARGRRCLFQKPAPAPSRPVNDDAVISKNAATLVTPRIKILTRTSAGVFIRARYRHRRRFNGKAHGLSAQVRPPRLKYDVAHTLAALFSDG